MGKTPSEENGRDKRMEPESSDGNADPAPVKKRRKGKRIESEVSRTVAEF